MTPDDIGRGRLRPSLPDFGWATDDVRALTTAATSLTSLPQAIAATGAKGRTCLYVAFTILGLVGRRA
ncbi:hypothetical protein MES4922_300046 [Mesorhizobium ventifaucium]|uniref:Uncharacterized protein n=1 Tax=Mesorhizobium ventifaucium TaxID=666020 RepID=A0ABN8JXQ5_9HYPH|nr:hypothetical protein MES4922_300046 [Mesorhizobium ventifaucium]